MSVLCQCEVENSLDNDWRCSPKSLPVCRDEAGIMTSIRPSTWPLLCRQCEVWEGSGPRPKGTVYSLSVLQSCWELESSHSLPSPQQMQHVHLHDHFVCPPFDTSCLVGTPSAVPFPPWWTPSPRNPPHPPRCTSTSRASTSPATAQSPPPGVRRPLHKGYLVDVHVLDVQAFTTPSLGPTNPGLTLRALLERETIPKVFSTSATTRTHSSATSASATSS
jgi:hypothetical protein